jgi:hypothetical protein
LDVAHKAKPLAREGPDEPLLPPAITQENSQDIDARRYGSIAYGSAIPHRLHKLLLRHHLVSLLDQMSEQLEYQGWRRQDGAVATQLKSSRIKHEILEAIAHRRIP